MLKSSLTFRPSWHFTRHSPLATRHSFVLLVVIAMLALFATVALSFVFYAESEATSMSYVAQSQTQAQADVDPEMLLSYFLSQFIYDTDNLMSAMRGHSLARTMFGQSPSDYNVLPYNGMGRLVTNPPPDPTKGQVDNVNLINYQYYPPNLPKGDNFVRYPEITDNLTSISSKQINSPVNALDPNSNRYVGGNVPWTYPDLNNMFLAAIDPITNTVLMPSFYRPWTYPSVPVKSLATYGKYATLRPRFLIKPPDNDSTAPAAIDPFGDMGLDVQNLDNSPGRLWSLVFTGFKGPNMTTAVVPVPAGSPKPANDSIWMDLGYPVLTAPNGKKYKALFAPLVTDLDNRLNLGIHGNLSGPNNTHASHQGWSRSEVNLSLLFPPNSPNYMKLFQSTNPDFSARYGAGGLPMGTPLQVPGNPAQSRLPPPLLLPPSYAMIDLDGVVRPPPSPANKLPYSMQMPAPASFSAFPTFPNTWYSGYGAFGAELLNHPATYRYFNPQGGNNPVMALSNQEAIMRLGGTNSPAMTSTLFQALQADLTNAGTRNLTTLLSMDLNRPGLMPYLWQAPGGSGQGQTSYSYTPSQNPTQGELYPKTHQTVTTPATNLGVQVFVQTPQASFAGDFDVSKNWRSTVAALKRVNINRYLTPYPLNTPTPTVPLQADTDRIALAREIYNMLIQLTGCKDPNVPSSNPTTQEFNAARFLAQIAVNIVDYVDEDDVITQFQWYNVGGAETVYGTELPRLVLNEVYAQLDNDGADPGFNGNPPVSKGGKPPKATYYNLNFWAELHNPFTPTPPPPLPTLQAYPANFGNASYQQAPGGSAILVGGTAPNTYAIYRLLVTKTNTKMGENNPKNVKGDPDLYTYVPGDPTKPGNYAKTWIVCKVDDFKTTPVTDGVVLPEPPPYYSSPPGSNKAFYVIGPNTTFVHDPTTPIKDRDPNFPQSTHATPLMTYQLATSETPNAGFDFLLQRLANPGMPADPAGNPYITVDYFQGVTPGGVPGGGVFAQENRTYSQLGYKGIGSLISSYNTIGKKQPYSSMWVPQARPPIANPPAQVVNTFFRHNAIDSTPPTPGSAWINLPNAPFYTMDVTPGDPQYRPAFDWLVHLDRPVINPLELMHVSGYPPHRLLQKFLIQDPRQVPNKPPLPPLKNGQRAFWEKQDALVYRFLDMVAPTDFMDWRDASNAQRSRVPGKININTIWDYQQIINNKGIASFESQIFNALVDAPPADTNVNQMITHFNQANVDPIWKSLLASRTPGIPNPSGGPNAPNFLVPQQNDNPFKPLSLGALGPNDTQYPNAGMDRSSILRTAAPGSPVRTGWLSNVPPHPYLQYELLSKIYNNITLRSNCFALWLTVGFFEVDDATMQIKGEIGRDENRQVRHRMFAIIDRTNLLMPVPANVQTNQQLTTLATGAAAGSGAQLRPFTVAQTQWKINGSGVNVAFSIRPGMQLTVGKAKQTETVEVLSVNHASRAITLKGGGFKIAHSAGDPVSLLGAWPRSLTPTLSPDIVFQVPNNPGYVTYGNPGPQEGYFDPRQNTLVVPYFSIIQ